MSDLVVLFPGIGYTCEKPLMYYGRKIAMEAGYNDCHGSKYEKIEKTGLQGNPEKMMEVFQYLYEATKKSLSEIKWAEYDRILFISKSIGTIVASAFENELTSSMNKQGITIAPIKQILFTPLEQTFIFHPSDAIGFTGTKDPWCNYEKVVALAKEQYIPINIYEDANHSLETGDTQKDITNLENVIEICKCFLNN